MSGRPMTAAFTLIELLISVALASLLTAVTITGFQQGRAMIERTESRIRMHANAQAFYAAFEHSVSSMMQHCAVVTASTQAAGPGTGSVTLLFMRGKEDTDDWLWQAQTTWSTSDLEWEEWKWQASNQCLLLATSSTQRPFTITQSFKPMGADDYNNQMFINLAQPRRTLSSTTPWTDLDRNLYFPTAAGATISAAAPGRDIGDYTDLANNLTPVVTHMSDFALQVVLHDGTVRVVDSTATAIAEQDGVWMDGRVTTAPVSPATATFPGSAISQRPKLLRLRFTLTDPVVGLNQTFSYSFALPGLAGLP